MIHAVPQSDLEPDLAASRDYDRMTAALAYLSENWRDQPDLAAAAKTVGLSPHHFQRVFTRWTGASPKRMVQALTHASARNLLVDGASVLDAALESGLSSPSRLHDVVVAEEAVTPGDVKAGGDGVVFKAGSAPTLLRIESRAGHGAGTPISKQIEIAADRWAFLWKALGME